MSKYASAHENPVEYYKKHYDGLSSTELQKEAKGFYNILRETANLDILPRKKNKSNYSEAYADPVGYYKKHYKGLSAEELRKKNEVFYRILKRANKLNILPKEQENSRRKSKYSEAYKDPVGYYKKHYDGLTASELNKQCQVLYRILLKTNNNGILPRKKK